MQSVIVKKSLHLLGQLIKTARQQRRLSQQALAVRLGVSRQTIMNIEKGDPTVAIGTVLETAHIVGIPILSGDKKTLNQWQAILTGFESLLPSKIRSPTREIEDDFG